jgi:hypothetical protein
MSSENTFISQVTASNESIKNEVKDHIRSSLQAINEYIWNSVDADAEEIKITIECNSKRPVKLIIEDNGSGIDYKKLDTELFGHTNDSPKKKIKKDYLSLPYGNNGHGRFAFIRFANRATWKSIYKEKDTLMEFETSIHSSDLVKFNGTKPKISENKSSGTTVTITDFNVDQDLINHESKSLEKIKNNILKEFYWIIAFKNIKILVNNDLIEISKICEIYQNETTISNKKFNIKLLRWKENYCKISNCHYLNSSGKEIYMTKTAISNIDDRFLHTVLVSGELFDKFLPASEKKRSNMSEGPLTSQEEFDVFNKLKQEINILSDNIRRKFSESFVKQKIEKFERKNYFEKIKLTKSEKIYKKPQIIAVTKEILRFAPKVFANLNEEQTLVFLNLINKLIDDDSNILLDILKVLVKPENEEALSDLRNLLEKYPLGNIVSTIKLIDERIDALEKIKRKVYDLKNYHLESELQEEIHKNFWLFGDEYTNIIGEGNGEDDFDRLYEEYCKLNNLEVLPLEESSKKQVDLFVYGKVGDGELEKNLIVEIKRPRREKDSKTFMKLGLTEYSQLEMYSEKIRKIPSFYSPNTKTWHFYLIGADLDDSFSYEDRSTHLMKTKPEHNFKLYSMTWIEILDRAKFRLEFVRNKLELKKKKIMLKIKVNK